MTRGESYKGEDGGLYGGGRNDPTASHFTEAVRLAARVQPLSTSGKPDEQGLIGLMAIGFSNTYLEFREFERLSRRERRVADTVRFVNGAQQHCGSESWASPATPKVNPWGVVDERLQLSGVARAQIQAAWIKLTPRTPGALGAFPLHVEQMTRDLREVLRRLADRFPNLKLAFLSSRAFGGYGTTELSPEPFAYESAFSVRQLIRTQMRGDSSLNHDDARGPVRSPLLLWGPYLWARGKTGRQTDNLTWTRADFDDEGTHPSAEGARKVGRLLLSFMQTDPAARSWFLTK